MLGLFQKKTDGRLQKFEGCYCKDYTKTILNKLFSCDMMSEINLKGNEKKIGITDTEILKVIFGKLFVY